MVLTPTQCLQLQRYRSDSPLQTHCALRGRRGLRSVEIHRVLDHAVSGSIKWMPCPTFSTPSPPSKYQWTRWWTPPSPYSKICPIRAERTWRKQGLWKSELRRVKIEERSRSKAFRFYSSPFTVHHSLLTLPFSFGKHLFGALLLPP